MRLSRVSSWVGLLRRLYSSPDRNSFSNILSGTGKTMVVAFSVEISVRVLS